MKSDFNERKNRRIAGYEKSAKNARKRSETAFGTADAISSQIPFGQPILVGHHSEKRHRRAADKITNSMRKGIEENEKADYFEQRAKSAENNRAIFSDDPNATEKLAEKIERLEKRQELMKAANKLAKKDDYDGLLDLGFSERQVTQILTPDSRGNVFAFESFVITNNGANLRRLKERLQLELKKAALVTADLKFDSGVVITQNAEDNRTQIKFPVARVSKEIYKELKSRGFRLTREGIWQRHLSDGALYWAKDIEKKYGEETKCSQEK